MRWKTFLARSGPLLLVIRSSLRFSSYGNWFLTAQMSPKVAPKQILLFVVGEDNAGTYLNYILPAHPDHNCEKDALVRRQRGLEGSYPSLSGRWGDQVDGTQILLAAYFLDFSLYWANSAVHLLSGTAAALCLERHHFTAPTDSHNKMEYDCVGYLLICLPV